MAGKIAALMENADYAEVVSVYSVENEMPSRGVSSVVLTNIADVFAGFGIGRDFFKGVVE